MASMNWVDIAQKLHVNSFREEIYAHACVQLSSPHQVGMFAPYHR